MIKPPGMAASVLSGVAAGVIFTRLWTLTARQE
jgi:hypothetical protein